MMNENIAYLRKRLAQFKKCGYDIIREREFAFKKAGFKKGKSVLEIGTGMGYMALTLARKGFKVITIDSDGRIQRFAKAILKYYHVEKIVRFRSMNAERLEFKDGAFDYVLAVNFLHHAKDPVRCLGEMARVAKEKVLIVDMNKRGAHILEKVHAQEGHRHDHPKIAFTEVQKFFRKAKMKVKTYRSRCQTVIVAKKGETQ
ncbi:MAG: class I SAM-dependent methyltransferase [Candidatus Omnitrophica bacterium]|nr:class I SAM-dependent methyltransferase [Candidatus Omnitrophota bacterium]